MFRAALEEILQEAREKAAAEVIAEKEAIINGWKTKAEKWEKLAASWAEDYQVEHTLRLQIGQAVETWRLIAFIGIPVALSLGVIITAVIFVF